jgi:hypothetical protein
MPRRVYLLGVGLALVALGLAVTDWALGPRPGVTEANFRRVREGMTLAEVQGIFGGPGKLSPFSPNLSVCCWWAGHSGEVYVTMRRDSKDGPLRVQSVLGWPFSDTPDPCPFSRLRAWLGW